MFFTCACDLCALHQFRSRVLGSISCLLEASFVVFRQPEMAHVRSTTHPRHDAPAQEGEYVAADRDVIDEGRDCARSVERSGLVHAGDTGSQSNSKCDSNGGSRTHSYNFGPSMVTVGRIRDKIERAYFAEGGAHPSGRNLFLSWRMMKPLFI
jgi:hypothetical protein